MIGIRPKKRTCLWLHNKTTMNQFETTVEPINFFSPTKESISPICVSDDEEFSREPPKHSVLTQSPMAVSNAYLSKSLVGLVEKFMVITQDEDDNDIATEVLEANEVIPQSPKRVPSNSIRLSAAFQQYTIDLSDSDDDEEMEDTEHPVRRVSFQLTDDGEIDEELGVSSFPTYALTPSLIKKCWYSKMERRCFKAEVPRDCRALASTEYRRSAIKIAALASREDALAVLEKDLTSQKALQVLTEPEARGYERAMMVLMMLPRKMMKAHSQNIVKLQQYQRNNGFTAEEISDALCEVSMASSSCCVRMARILARGDELALESHCLSA